MPPCSFQGKTPGRRWSVIRIKVASRTRPGNAKISLDGKLTEIYTVYLTRPHSKRPQRISSNPWERGLLMACEVQIPAYRSNVDRSCRCRYARLECTQSRQTNPISHVFGFKMRIERKSKANQSQFEGLGSLRGRNGRLRCTHSCKTNPIFAVPGLKMRVAPESKAKQTQFPDRTVKPRSERFDGPIPTAPKPTAAILAHRPRTRDRLSHGQIDTYSTNRLRARHLHGIALGRLHTARTEPFEMRIENEIR